MKQYIYTRLANFHMKRAIRYQNKKRKAKDTATRYAIKGGIYK